MGMTMQPKIKIGQAYQPERTARRGCNGTYSAYRPQHGHGIDVDKWNDPIGRYLPIVCAVGFVAVFVMLAVGIIK
jgi:hypothetical protein